MNQAVKTIMEEKSDSEDIKSINQVVQKKFLDERKIFLWGEVNDKSCRDVTERLLYLETTDPGKEIILYLNSPGGSVDAGMAVFDTMKLISSPITVVVTAMAASMGSILLCAASDGQRLLYPHARVMIHQPLIGGQMMGAAVDINIYAQEMEKNARGNKSHFVKIVRPALGKSTKRYRSRLLYECPGDNRLRTGRQNSGQSLGLSVFPVWGDLKGTVERITN